jgi:hypothetical protein
MKNWNVTTKILIGVVTVGVTGTTAWLIYKAIKKAKDKKKENINPALATNQNGLATTTNALDLIQKAKESDAKRQANAPAGTKYSQNWIAGLDSNSVAKEMYLKEFIDNKVTFDEYNAVLKYFSSFEKNESETIKKLSQKEQELLRSFDSKLPFRKKLP